MENKVDKVFLNVRKRFLQRIAALIARYEDFLVDLESGKADADAIQEMYAQIHKTAGTARAFEFIELSDKSIELEGYFEALSEGNDAEENTNEILKIFPSYLIEINHLISTHLKKSDLQAKPIKSAPIKELTKYDYTILIADDDDLVQDLLKQELAKHKCRVITAVDGKQALELLSTETIDFIALDLHMPKMNGMEVLLQIKKSGDHKNISVIMLTRSDRDKNVIESLSAGAVDYITKPFEASELATKINNILKHHKRTILVVDDDETVCDLLDYRFSRLGYNVETIRTGTEAYKWLEKNKPDLIILDVMLPGMDGMSLLRHAQENVDLKKVPIVMLTAKTQQNNIIEGIDSGAYDYITKPFDMDELVARVSAILRRL